MLAICSGAILLLCFGLRGTAAQRSSSEPPEVKIDSVHEALRIFNRSIVVPNQIQHEAACAFLRNHFTGALRSSLIFDLDPFAFLSLTGKGWVTEEIEVFIAVRNWATAHGASNERILKQILRNVFLVAMNADQIQQIVLPSKLFTKEEIIEALSIKAWRVDDNKFLRFPNQLATNDVIVQTLGARIIRGKCRDPNQQLLSSNKSASIDHFCYHDISRPSESIIVRLGTGFTIDTVKVRLFDFDTRRYSFEVDVSADAQQWTNKNRLEYVRGMQVFRFEPISVNFIRINGTRRFPSGPSQFVITEIQAMHSRP